MKILIAFYSRTGTTKKIAEAIASKKGADVEIIIDTVERGGAMGFLRSGRDAMKKKLTKLGPLKFEPDQYDLVIIGTPIWGWNMSVPVRTYVTEQKNKFKNVAFFCTMGGSGDETAFSEMENIIGKKPIVTLAIKTKDVATNNYSGSLEEFISKIRD
jgi:flavodoxin